ncbi:MAG: T9SS type A sorting domain-containing protein [bacterium]
MYAYHCFENVDIDGDSKEDLVVSNFRNQCLENNLLVYYFQDGKYHKDNNFNPDFQGFECLHIVKGNDFDNDDDIDIATTGHRSDVYIFINDGNELNQTPIIVDDEGRGFIDLDWGDFDNDGDSDLVATTVKTNIRVYEYENNSFSRKYNLDCGSQSNKVCLNDINNDGFVDIIAAKRNGTVVIFKNSNGSFSETPDFSPSSGHGCMAFDAGDINRDGYSDIVAVDDGNLIVYNNVNGHIQDPPEQINNSVPCYAKDILLHDLNNDDYPDLIVSNFNRNDMIFINDQGQFHSTPSWSSPYIKPTFSINIFNDQDNEKIISFGVCRGDSLEFYTVSPGTGLIDDPEHNNPKELYVLQNYPNPFNQVTTVVYSLPKSEQITISIYDLNGKLIETLVNNKMPAGTHTMYWNASHVSSGIYFIRYQTAEYTKSKKCILLK